MKYILGIDGGGTRTRAAIMTEQGKLLGIGQGGPSNLKSAGIEKAGESIHMATSEALQKAGVEIEKFDAVFCGVAGVRSSEEREMIRQKVASLGYAHADQISIDHDLRTALTGALQGEEGIVIVTATGSACYGRNNQGESWQAGGWGWVMDDVGSAYWYGALALAATARAVDGRGEDTALKDMLVTALNAPDPRELPAIVHGFDNLRERVAKLAPLVFKAAREGDQIALSLIETGCTEMAEMARAVATKLGLKKQGLKVVISGGVTKAGDTLLEPLGLAFSEILPEAEIVEAELPPVLGACLLGMEMLGIPLAEAASRLE